MMGRRARLSWSSLVLLAACAQVHAITLLQAYEAALQNDPAYRAAKAERDAGRENRALGRSALLPNLSGSWSGSRVHADIDFGKNALGREVITHPDYLSRSAVVQLRQPLFNLEALARYQQGDALARQSEAQFDARTQEAVVRVAGAYFDALFAQDQLALAQAQRDALAEQRKVNDRLFEKGEGTRTDMLETQARLDVSEAELLEAQGALREARATLADLIKREVGNLEGLRGAFTARPVEPHDYAAWKMQALARNPDIAAAARAVEVAREEVGKARAGHMPRVDLVAIYNKSDSETINTLNENIRQRSLGVQVNIPLFAGGYVSALTRQAAAGLEKSRAQLEVQTGKVIAELRKQYDDVESGVARIAALDKAVESGTLLVKATEGSIRGGVRINLDLVNARQQLYTSLRDRARARYNYLLALLRLRAAAGTLGDADVRAMARYFR